MLDTALTIPALDLPLTAHWHRPNPREHALPPLVILVHGFKGFMDWGPWPWVAQRLTEAGCACLRFNFSHNGIGPDPEAFTEAQLFEDNTFTREVLELGAVLQTAATLPGIDPTRIILVGHSLGGAIAILAAAAAPGPPVGAVVTWAGVASLEGLLGFAGQEAAWRRDGFLPVRNARTGQVMRVGVGLLEDWEANRTALEVPAALRELVAAGIPVTAIHGTQDTAVPFAHAQRMAAAGAHLVPVEGANHTFGATHPFQSDPPPFLRKALEATCTAIDQA